jgi:hypothetical protein
MVEKEENEIGKYISIFKILLIAFTNCFDKHKIYGTCIWRAGHSGDIPVAIKNMFFTSAVLQTWRVYKAMMRDR